MSQRSKLALFGAELLKHPSLESGIPLISSYLKETTKAQRCSIYIYDKAQQKLWTTIADGIETITIDVKEGIVGQTVRETRPIIENHPYSNPNFNQQVDKRSGYVTENIASLPVFDSQHNVLGVLQLLNKTGGFDEEDVRFMLFFAHYISGYIELSTYFDSK